jgi:hypothetical protein
MHWLHVYVFVAYIESQTSISVCKHQITSICIYIHSICAYTYIHTHTQMLTASAKWLQFWHQAPHFVQYTYGHMHKYINTPTLKVRLHTHTHTHTQILTASAKRLQAWRQVPHFVQSDAFAQHHHVRAVWRCPSPDSQSVCVCIYRHACTYIMYTRAYANRPCVCNAVHK